MELKPGTILQGGKYEIRNTLGSGGFGITYLAEHHMMNKLVCIKEFFPREYYNRDGDSQRVSLGSQGSAQLMETYRNKFVKEARTIARLEHPNVIAIHDVFEENNTAYYVMEYVEGDTLSGLVKRQGPMDGETAKEYILKVAEALRYIHSHNLLHLDIKPAIIIIRRSDKRVVLIDFGMSKQYDNEGNQTSSTPVGISQGYAPPEQYEQGAGNNLSPATDIYALGATLYYITTGKTPPTASVIMDGELPTLVKSLSPTIQQVILGSLNPTRRKRPDSIDGFIALFDEPTLISRPKVNVEPEKPQYHGKQQPQQNHGARQEQQQTPPPYKKPSSGMAMAIITTLTCCMPFGIIAIIYAAKVDSLWRRGLYDKAYKAARTAKGWIIAAIVSVILSFVVYIGSAFLVGFAEGLASEEDIDEYYYDDYSDDYYY